jgi:hypothetical protein
MHTWAQTSLSGGPSKREAKGEVCDRRPRLRTMSYCQVIQDRNDSNYLYLKCLRLTVLSQMMIGLGMTEHDELEAGELHFT